MTYELHNPTLATLPDALMANPDTAGTSESSASLYIERRAYVRLACDLPADVHSGDEGRSIGWPGKVRNLSRGGLALMVTHCFRPGTNLEIDIRDRAGDLVRTLHVCVAHATAVFLEGNHRWLLGCQLTETLTDVEFETLRVFFGLKAPPSPHSN